MSWHRRILNAVRGNRLSGQLDREFHFHLAELVDELVASGMTPVQAEREARRRFGNYGAQKERTRDINIVAWLDSLWGDVRYAFRSLRSSPGFTTVAILSLALGIGANTAIFSLINTVVLKSLPVSRPAELLRVATVQPGSTTTSFTNPLWEQLRDNQHGFQGLFAYSQTAFDLSAGGASRRGWGSYVSGDYFATLGVGAQLGRTVLRSDDVPGCPPVAVISDAFWLKEFGRDPAVAGKMLTLNGQGFQILGVAQRGFDGLDVGLPTGFFMPICSEPILRKQFSALRHPSTWWLRVIGRPAPGVSVTQLSSMIAGVGHTAIEATVSGSWKPDRQAAYRSTRFDLSSASTGLSNTRTTYRKALTVMMAIAGLVLLIACANVANLLLARAAARRGEVAVRMGLGAGRARVLRQLLTESLVLAVCGAGLGVAFAIWASHVLSGMMTIFGQPVVLDLGVDSRMLAFTAGVAILTAIIFGIAPAWRASDVDPQFVTRGAGRGVVPGRSRWTLGKSLIALQVAMSVALVAGAALFVGTFRRLVSMESGFTSEGVLVAYADLRYATTSEAQYPVIYRDLLNRIRTIPGVSVAGMAWTTPLDGSSQTDDITLDGARAEPGKNQESYFDRVAPGFFEALNIPVVAGRVLSDADAATVPRVAVVNQAFVRKFFPRGDPLGHTYQTAGPEAVPVSIVGVVADARFGSLRDAPVPMAFLPLAMDSSMGNGNFFVVRGTIATQTLQRQLLAIGASINRGIGFTFRPMRDQVLATLTQERLLARLSGTFAVIALLLAAIGLYGLMSYDVSRRRNEIGIRMALGASAGGVMRMILREVVVIAGIGIVLGFVMTLATGRFITSFLYGIAPGDIRITMAAAALLVAVTLLSGYLPARRAARQDPMSALREQ